MPEVPSMSFAGIPLLSCVFSDVADCQSDSRSQNHVAFDVSLTVVSFDEGTQVSAESLDQLSLTKDGGGPHRNGCGDQAR